MVPIQVLVGTAAGREGRRGGPRWNSFHLSQDGHMGEARVWFHSKVLTKARSTLFFGLVHEWAHCIQICWIWTSPHYSSIRTPLWVQV